MALFASSIQIFCDVQQTLHRNLRSLKCSLSIYISLPSVFLLLMKSRILEEPMQIITPKHTREYSSCQSRLCSLKIQFSAPHFQKHLFYFLSFSIFQTRFSGLFLISSLMKCAVYLRFAKSNNPSEALLANGAPVDIFLERGESGI